MEDYPTEEISNAVKLYTDTFKSDDLPQRISALHNLAIYCATLSLSCIQKDILPLLKDTLEDDDEVLMVIAEELGKFYAFGAGVMVLPFLEFLARSEDNLVRSRVAHSLCQIVDSIQNDPAAEEQFYKLIGRLALSDRFGPRSLCCEIMHHIYSRCKDQDKSELRGMFRALCEDKEQEVRKSAFSNIKSLISLMDQEDIKNEYLDFLRILTKEEIDVIKIHAIHSTIAIAMHLGPDLPRIKAAFTSFFVDKSWKVRCTAAKNFGDIAILFQNRNGSDLISYFPKLLLDYEVEVRVAATQQISAVCANLPSQMIESFILPVLNNLLSDESYFVRAALASDITNICVIIGKQNGLTVLFEVFRRLLKDENPTVSLTMATNIEKIIKFLGNDILQLLVPSILELCEEKQWRGRVEALNSFSLFAQYWEADEFGRIFGASILDFLQDCVYMIRQAAIKNIHKLTIIYGDEWFHKQVFPKLFEHTKNPNYLIRITVLNTLCTICPVILSEDIRLACLNLILSLAVDPIPNVRLNVCKALAPYAKVMSQEIFEDKIKTVIIKYNSFDPDKDVLYYSRFVSANTQ
jgi:serine/threonine-protein phosphatase 2A regulatory subunit A